MVVSTSRFAYLDCYELLDRALEDGHGVRVRFDARGDAFHFRMRLNYARKLDREGNMQTYAVDHPSYGRSEYDKLVATVEEDTEGMWWVYVKHRAIVGVVESLSEGG